MNKIIIIGDSFCGKMDWVRPQPNESKSFWPEVLKDKLVDYEVIVDSYPSRDIQTIIENWIRLIKHLKENDFLIICLPYFRRTRLPLDENHYTQSKIDEDTLYTRFVGTPSYNNDYTSLEFWGKDNTWKYFENKLSHQEIINTSISNQKTTLEVIESLIELTKSKTYVFSWDYMDIKSSKIEDKDTLISNIGFWETHQDVYQLTNGQFGLEGDFHWSYRMNLYFGNYLINKLITSYGTN
jgi:hypothetical protein